MRTKNKNFEDKILKENEDNEDHPLAHEERVFGGGFTPNFDAGNAPAGGESGCFEGKF